MYQDHVSRFSAWVPPFPALSAQLFLPVAWSVGSLRFLVLPFPTEEFCLLCSWPPRSIDPLRDLIGVTTFRMSEKQLVRMPSLLRGLGIRSRNSFAYEDHDPFIIV